MGNQPGIETHAQARRPQHKIKIGGVVALQVAEGEGRMDDGEMKSQGGSPQARGFAGFSATSHALVGSGQVLEDH
eukprot:GAFH01005753.1.p4 GENE.GAFH01005753.1~~GAFH01005753.1.p4  ORF type:complete len:75 (+),score=0.85 GAFH01005753.1:137-361(+)